MATDLVGLGVGGVRKGSSEAIVGNLSIPLEEVNVNLFLAVAAACSAKKIVSELAGVEAVGVAVYARGDPGVQRIDYLEVEVEVAGDVSEQDVEGALWGCPIMSFLRERVKRVGVKVRR